MLLSNCTICGDKKSKFIRNQKASGLLGKLRQIEFTYSTGRPFKDSKE